VRWFFKAKHKEKPRCGGIYGRSDWLIIHPVNEATSGVGIASSPVFRVPVTASQEEIGEAIIAALAAFKSGVQHHDCTSHGKEFLKAAGFRSWRALYSNAVYCSFSDDGISLRFEPHAYGGTRGDQKGFQPLGAAEVVASSQASATEIGAAALVALSQAR
jgi:hypothetical protein